MNFYYHFPKRHKEVSTVSTIYKIKNTLLKLEITVTIFLLLVTFTIVIVEVIFRYLGIPLYWAEEIARYSFVWLIMFGCIVGIEKKIHFQIDFFAKSLNKKLQKIIFYISNLITGVFLFFLAYKGIILCIKAQGATSPALGVPQYYAYMAIPITAILMLFHLSIQIYEGMKERVN